MQPLINKLSSISAAKKFGRVKAIQGLMIEVVGLEGMVSVGDKCTIISVKNERYLCEVTAIDESKCVVMPFYDISNVNVGCIVEVEENSSVFYPSEKWLGRVLNALGKPVDEKGVLENGSTPYPLRNPPIPAHKRGLVEGKLDLGVKAMNVFTTLCTGQRMGIFAGSGVGKSVLVSMLTKYSEAEVKVIGLVGERGRELQEFLHKYLGAEGIKKAVIIAATSDESALMRRQAAYLTLSVAEYFRDQGKKVLCIIDSVTRFALAQREIGLASGEPPATRGYTPSVFAEMPKLLERAGPGKQGEKGSITGLFTILVEGDDMNEPISDTVRGILDGHIVLDRKIADRGRFPAINVLRSISRTMPDCNNDAENVIVSRAKRLLATYDDMSEMIRLGAYRKGSDAEIDEAIKYYNKLEEFISQKPTEGFSLAQGYEMLKGVLS